MCACRGWGWTQAFTRHGIHMEVWGQLLFGSHFSWFLETEQVFGLAWQTLLLTDPSCQPREGIFYPKFLLSGWQGQWTANLIFSLHFNFLFDQKDTFLHWRWAFETSSSAPPQCSSWLWQLIYFPHNRLSPSDPPPGGRIRRSSTKGMMHLPVFCEDVIKRRVCEVPGFHSSVHLKWKRSASQGAHLGSWGGILCLALKLDA